MTSDCGVNLSLQTRRENNGMVACSLGNGKGTRGAACPGFVPVAGLLVTGGHFD